ncbi:hypothetical protein [Acetobacter persici]|uniref:Uncharacterized protein n=1 Tax=Acetobacter persici TaxID=1076596 RepID=A0A1U9LJH2_9PROT|nr:hypothetical protein [Acetobacter persici]AQT06499.1 hypothetical protein A0U91_15950 [Acetobacter persici]
MKTPEQAFEGEWDFNGSCAPAEGSTGIYGKFLGQQTFTLGCFQWIKRSRGNKLKQGKVQKRIKGFTSNPDEAYEKARQFCATKNSEITAKKSAE